MMSIKMLQVSHLFAEWCRICELPGMNDASYAHYISQLQQSGLLKGDDITDRFFCILTHTVIPLQHLVSFGLNLVGRAFEFQDDSLESHQHFLIFGGGCRLCLGKELAIVEICTFLHYFVTKYRLAT
ncbi:cytochrome P450 724B1-like [Magnolia sinica]|uniref:cytochrome P450 724B1-like n=1 Tax=Magnolia sinica TaxID=86752 RepID=UPI002657D0A1|nr:cytochrome P450 724B1-like [Magnolia sinica]